MNFTSSAAAKAGASGTHQAPSDVAAQQALRFVGAGLHRLSDDEREQHILDCTRLMEEAYQRFEDSSNFADRGEADGWRILRDQAIKGRSAAQVRRMEQRRGLCGR